MIREMVMHKDRVVFFASEDNFRDETYFLLIASFEILFRKHFFFKLPHV